jgi:hypothetical protein
MDALKENVCEELAASADLNPRRWTVRSFTLLLCVLFVRTLVIVRGIHTGEFSYNVDETQHAGTGLYFADLVRDHPFTHLMQYTYR